MQKFEMPEIKQANRRAPLDARKAFAYFVGKCAEGLGAELLAEGKTDTEARSAIIHLFLDFAAGEACRIARREGREPDHEKWTKAVSDAFARAIKRTAEDQGGGK